MPFPLSQQPCSPFGGDAISGHVVLPRLTRLPSYVLSRTSFAEAFPRANGNRQKQSGAFHNSIPGNAINSSKHYRESGVGNATGRAGAANMTARALLGKDGNTTV